MKAVVLLSGGLDSAVLLADRVRHGDECRALTFDYGQRNRYREVGAAAEVAEHYGVRHTVIPLDRRIFGLSALLGNSEVPDGHAEEPDATEVVGRNMVFLSCGAAYAASAGAACVLFGANAGDRAGYPDCRPEFIRHIGDAGYYSHGVRVAAPYMFADKAEITRLGVELGAPLDLTWSCYNDFAGPCGRCGACVSRREAAQ